MNQKMKKALWGALALFGGMILYDIIVALF